MKVTFLGVRGSTPTPGPSTVRYGGNTSCVLVEPADGPAILCDLGTGSKRLADGPFVGVCLVSHLHFDHIQGLPFAGGLIHPGTELDLYGPPQEQGDLEAAFRDFLRPPVFPITIDDLPGVFRFHQIGQERVEISPGVVVEAGPVPHPGPTNGYRVEADGCSVVFVPDHQEPDDPTTVDPAVVHLARDADLLIHDAQYTPEEFAVKRTWGHCTIAYAVHVARTAGVRHLAMFHHDPSHDDPTVDQLLAGAVDVAAGQLVVSAAAEGAVIEVSPCDVAASTAGTAGA